MRCHFWDGPESYVSKSKSHIEISYVPQVNTANIPNNRKLALYYFYLLYLCNICN
jgi:hypothetical protein